MALSALRPMLLLAVLAAASLAAFAPRAAAADTGLDSEGPPDDDLSVQLVDMFAAMADAIAARQDQTANEAYLGSRASQNRLRAAIVHAPDVTLRFGPRPFFSGCLFCED